MKKIPFNDRYMLTKAVLEGRKTQTRRLAKVDNDVLEAFKLEYYNATLDCLDGLDLIKAYFLNNPKKIPYKVGEVVAVAQSYKEIDDFYKTASLRNHSIYDCVSDSDIQKWNMIAVNYRGKTVWTNKLFVKPDLMVHFIQITNVRIERLQDISDDDCIKEGIEHLQNGGGLKPYSFYDTSIKVKSEKEGVSYGWYRDYDTSRKAYADLINRVGKKGTWESNPYVFVYDFKLIK